MSSHFTYDPKTDFQSKVWDLPAPWDHIQHAYSWALPPQPQFPGAIPKISSSAKLEVALKHVHV